VKFDEAVEKSFPGFVQEAKAHPDRLIILGSIPHNPFDPDGSGRIHVIGAPDLANLKEIMEVVEVLYFIWQQDLYQVKEDKTNVFVDWMKHGFPLA
jgi:hypothetical protein